MEYLPKDVLQLIFRYLGLEMMIIMQRISVNFNILLIEVIKQELKDITEFDTELLSTDLLINLCKINIIRSNVFAGDDRSFITTDERTSCSTLNQVFRFGGAIKTPQIVGGICDV